MPDSLPLLPFSACYSKYMLFPSGPGGDATYNFYRSIAKSTTIPTNQTIGAYPGLAPGGAGTPAVKECTFLFTCSFACMRPHRAT